MSVLEIFLFILLCIILALMIGSILLQKSEGGALAGFGSSDVSQYLGVRGAANFLSRATMVLAVLFVLDVLFLAILIDKSAASNSFLTKIQQSSKQMEKQSANAEMTKNTSKPQSTDQNKQTESSTSTTPKSSAAASQASQEKKS